MSESYLSSALNMLNSAAHAVAPSMFEDSSNLGKMEGGIPIPPPLPTDESMNKHYLARDKTIENASSALRSAANFMKEVAVDLSAALPSAADLGLATKLDARGIPVPPPMPTEEDMHKHYLIPVPPPQPTSAMLHQHFLIPVAPPMPTKEDLNRHYLSRDRRMEDLQNSVRSAATYVSEVASDLSQSLRSTAPSVSISSQEHIPVPPALPTREMMHKHYLIPVAPPMPSAEGLNKHYLSRNKTIENVQNSARSAYNLLSEVAQEVKDYVMETPISSYPADLKEAILPTPVDSNGIPVPPALPTQEMMHKHHLIPVAPPMPSAENLNKHYLSRDRTIENVQTSARSAVNYVAEVASELTATAASSIKSVPAKATEAGAAASEKLSEVSESISSTAQQVGEAVSDKAQQIKEKVLGAAPSQGAVYTRGTGVSESPILRKHVTVGGRRIVPRTNYEGFKPLLQ